MWYCHIHNHLENVVVVVVVDDVAVVVNAVFIENTIDRKIVNTIDCDNNILFPLRTGRIHNSSSKNKLS